VKTSRGVARLPESREVNTWSWLSQDSEPRMTVLARIISNLPDRQTKWKLIAHLLLSILISEESFVLVTYISIIAVISSCCLFSRRSTHKLWVAIILSGQINLRAVMLPTTRIQMVSVEILSKIFSYFHHNQHVLSQKIFVMQLPIRKLLSCCSLI
jgi:hypothetical protein